ncbi:MAG: hypothetical protein ACYC2T_12300 [Bacillota bacterium]
MGEYQDLHERPDLQAYEQIIKQVRGVHSARIVADSSGVIQEIHVMADPLRAPKQVVRDIESAVMVQLGIALDHKKISVVQIKGEGLPDGEMTLGRFRWISLQVTTKGASARIKIELESEGRLFSGEAAGPNTASNQLKLVAEATIEAVEAAVGGYRGLIIEDLSKVQLAGRQAVMVFVSQAGATDSETLLGACIVRHDEREAVGKATLSALNRRLAKIAREQE